MNCYKWDNNIKLNIKDFRKSNLNNDILLKKNLFNRIKKNKENIEGNIKKDAEVVEEIGEEKELDNKNKES